MAAGRLFKPASSRLLLTHSQYFCSQGILTCHRKKFSEYLCLTHFTSQRINGHTLSELDFRGMSINPNDPGCQRLQNSSAQGPIPPWCLESADSSFFPQLEKGWSRFLMFSFLPVPSVTFLSLQSSPTCTLSLGLKYQMVSHYLMKTLQTRVRILTLSTRALQLCNIFNSPELPTCRNIPRGTEACMQ